MRIAHLPSSYFPDSLGGTEVYVQTLCQELEHFGHQTAVVWHTMGKTGNTPENAFRLPRLPRCQRYDLYRKFTASEPPGFVPFLRDWKPDLVHFHAYTLGAGNDHAECCRRENIPYVITYHTPTMSCPNGTLIREGTEVCDGRLDPQRCSACCLQKRGWPKSLARLLSRSPLGLRTIPDSPLTTRFALPSLLAESNRLWARFFGGARHVIACAEFCCGVLVANGISKNRITVQRQGLPGLDRERTLRLPVCVREGEPIRIGYFGRIDPVKLPGTIPRIVNALHAGGLSVAGEWVGPITGPARWAQAMFASGAPLMRYGGVKRGDELRAWIRSRDLIVFPGHWLETGPLTLLEAWDEGTPVIGIDLGGIHDFVASNGLSQCLFGAGSPSSAIAAAKRMLHWSGLPPVVRVPGMRGVAERMMEIYHRACQQPAEQTAGVIG